MAEARTIARPYAKAAFSTAKDTDTVAEWSEKLALFSGVAQAAEKMSLLSHPEFTGEVAISIFTEIAKVEADSVFGRFLLELSRFRRFTLLPEIHMLFEAYRRESEKTLAVTLTTAQPVTDEITRQFQDRLKARFGCEIQIETSHSPEILGGAIVQVGDRVIDGSVRGRLNKLADSLLA